MGGGTRSRGKERCWGREWSERGRSEERERDRSGGKERSEGERCGVYGGGGVGVGEWGKLRKEVGERSREGGKGAERSGGRKKRSKAWRSDEREWKKGVNR